ncbi:MAG: hypothetical protein HRF47_02580 [Chloroflexota bacterium]|jgi:hypothetical protein
MDENTKLTRLKRVLVFKMLVVLFLWGLPTWIAPESVLNLFGETLPDLPFYMRIFGATQIGLVFLYWLAYRNPLKNRDMIRYAVVDNAVAFLTMMGYAFTVGITNPTVWISAALVLFFAIAFYLLTPKAA